METIKILRVFIFFMLFLLIVLWSFMAFSEEQAGGREVQINTSIDKN